MQPVPCLARGHLGIKRYGGTAVSISGEKSSEQMLGMSMSHEVPGAKVYLGRFDDVMAYLDRYLGF